MLVAFRVRNFRSFNAEIGMRLVASNDNTYSAVNCIDTPFKALPRVTKSAVIFGANGSGKTNFLLALSTMREFVLNSTTYSAAEFAGKYLPFAFSNSQTATRFEIDIIIHEVRYLYSFSYDSQRIVEENLLVYKKGKAQRWIARTVSAATQCDHWEPFSSNFNGPKETWRKATRSTALFLTTASRLNATQLIPLVNWFEHGVSIVTAAEVSDLKPTSRRISDRTFKLKLIRLLGSLDARIADIRVSPANSRGLQRPHRHDAQVQEPDATSKLEFLHGKQDAPLGWLTSDFQGKGTLRLAALLIPLLDALEHGRLIAIDEFGVGLHPLVGRFLVNLIHDPTTAPGTQLLINTHDLTLMNLDMFRRDEIWLMTRGKEGASSLSRLSVHSPRKRVGLTKNYLKGQFGATPTITP